MAFGQFEDLTGKMEVIFFPEAYASAQEILKRAATEAEPLLVVAELETADEQPKLLVKTVEWVSDAHKNRVQQVVLKLSPGEVQADQLRELKKNLLQHPGRCPVRIEFQDPTFRTRLELPKSVGVAATPQMVRSINLIFGREVVTLR